MLISHWIDELNPQAIMLNGEVRIHELRLWNAMLSCTFITWTETRFGGFITAIKVWNEHDDEWRTNVKKTKTVLWGALMLYDAWRIWISNEERYTEGRSVMWTFFVLDFTMNWNENGASAVCNQSALSLLFPIVECFHSVGEQGFGLNPV